METQADYGIESGYAAGAFHIVEGQLAKAAWRTAWWLNTIASAYFGQSSIDGVRNPKDETLGPGSFDEPLVEILPVLDVVKQDL